MNFRCDSLEPKQVYKLLTSVVVPRPIAFVTSLDGEGRLNAAPFSFFNAVGHRPPTVVLGIEKKPDGVTKDTAANIRATGAFVVNLVDQALEEQMNECATDFPADWNEIEITGIAIEPAKDVPVPRIVDAPANLECELDTILERESFWLVVGTVLRIHVRDEAFDADKFYVDHPKLGNIGRLAGSGYVRTTDLFSMHRMTFEEWQKLKKDSEGRNS